MARPSSIYVMALALVLLGCGRHSGSRGKPPAEDSIRHVRVVKSGDEDAIKALLDEIDNEGTESIPGHWWVAFKERHIDGADAAKIIGEKFERTDDPVVKAKLCSILGSNGTREAAALLRSYISKENDVNVLSNAVEALRRCEPRTEGLGILKALKGDDRRPEHCFGYASIPTRTLAEQAEQAHHSIRTKLKLTTDDTDFAW